MTSDDITSFIDSLYSDCETGDEEACDDIQDLLVGANDISVTDQQIIDYLQLLYDDCQNGDQQACDTLQNSLEEYFGSGTAACNTLYEDCVSSGVSEESCQAIQQECVENNICLSDFYECLDGGEDMYTCVSAYSGCVSIESCD